MTRSRIIPGFTLVELIVAVIVGAIVAGATTTAVANFLVGRARATARAESHRRASLAVDRVAADVLAVIRDRELSVTRVSITDSLGGAHDSDGILLYVRTMKPVRGSAESPEGDEAEVQYKIFPGTDSLGELWRRADPVPDGAPDAGGLAAPITDHVLSFTVRASDGAAWYDSWESDSSGFPHLISIQATAVSDDASTSATARRVIALDRTPLPPPLPAEETTGAAAPTGTTGGSR